MKRRKGRRKRKTVIRARRRKPPAGKEPPFAPRYAINTVETIDVDIGVEHQELRRFSHVPLRWSGGRVGGCQLARHGVKGDARGREAGEGEAGKKKRTRGGEERDAIQDLLDERVYILVSSLSPPSRTLLARPRFPRVASVCLEIFLLDSMDISNGVISLIITGRFPKFFSEIKIINN